MTDDVAPVLTGLPLPLERIEAEMVELAGQLAGGTCRFLLLVGEYDAAEGWRQWGMNSTAHWLSWHCGLGVTAGYEQVRVARKLREFPAIVELFAAGRLSYSKVRAITRIATPETVETLVDWAEHATAGQLDRIVAGQRRAVRASDVRARKAARSVNYHWDEDGSLVGTFRLPPEDAARFLQGLQVATAQLPDPVVEADQTEEDSVQACQTCRDSSAEELAAGQVTLERLTEWCPHIRHDPPKLRRARKSTADALVAMADQMITAAQRSASDGQDPAGGLPGLGADRFELVIHSSAEELAHPDDGDDDNPGGITLDGRRLHPSTGRRLTCGCPYTVQVDDEHGNPLHLGRKTRRIRGRLARAVHRRDGGRCQAPGCTKATTQIHHRRHWANGGPTCITNLISLCDSHHWLVHEGGWTITTNPTRGWTFHTPDGYAIAATPEPAVPNTPLPHDPSIRADAISGDHANEPFNLGDAASWLCNQPSRA